MIRYSGYRNRNDAIYYNLVRISLDFIKSLLDGNEVEDLFPNACQCFDKETIYQALEELERVHLDKNLWDISDYLWMVLYDALQYEVELANEYAYNNYAQCEDEEEIKSFCEYAGYRIKKIDFELLIEEYFWDTDFLFEKELMANSDLKTRETMGLSPETYGLCLGMKPHKEELIATLNKKGNYKPSKPSKWELKNLYGINKEQKKGNK